MDPAESGRRGEDHDITGPQSVDRLLVGVEAEELTVLRDVDFVLVHVLERVVARAEPVLKDVGHSHELGRTGCH